MNFIVLSYARNDKAKLYVNGRKVDEDSVSDHAAFSAGMGALAVAFAATAHPTTPAAMNACACTICDAFMAAQALTDDEVNEIYRAFVLGVPLMQLTLTEAT